MTADPIGNELVGYGDLEFAIAGWLSLGGLEPLAEGLVVNASCDVIEAIPPLLRVTYRLDQIASPAQDFCTYPQ